MFAGLDKSKKDKEDQSEKCSILFVKFNNNASVNDVENRCHHSGLMV